MKLNSLREFLPFFLENGTIVPSEDGTAFRLGWGQSWLSASFEPGKLSVFAPDFFLTSAKPWRVFPNFCEVSAVELRAELSKLQLEPAEAADWENPDREQFEESFRDLQGRLNAGELKKAVPVIFARACGRFGKNEVASVLVRALDMATSSPLRVYGFWTAAGEGLREGMLGATPEMLFRQNGGELATVAVAGTRPHSAADRLPLLEDPKELEEHRFVIDGIASALAAWGSVEVGETRELKLKTFSHLLTPIRAILSEAVNFDRIARALHPTPALGAWPREQGLRWLEGLQRFGDRRRFGAPFGALVNEGDGICWVAIRGLQWFADSSTAPGEARLLLGAGCGVTAKSELEREWDELAIKLESIRMALGV